jgi:hypothetical protein
MKGYQRMNQMQQDPSDEQVRRIARATVILLQADLRQSTNKATEAEA